MDVSETQVAWLAGLLEGEGSFMLNKNRVGGKVYRYPQIAVNMTDRDIIERAASLFGNAVYDMPPPRKYPDRLPQFRTQVSGAGAAEWMRTLYPWLGFRRRAKIDEILAAWAAREPTAVRRRNACSAATVGRPRNGEGRFV